MRRASASLSPDLLKWSGKEQRRGEGGEIDGKGERGTIFVSGQLESLCLGHSWEVMRCPGFRLQ